MATEGGQMENGCFHEPVKLKGARDRWVLAVQGQGAGEKIACRDGLFIKKDDGHILNWWNNCQK